ncbi:hypothetical protein BH24ACT5_BH24ACT5_25420 [soil metagenome]
MRQADRRHGRTKCELSDQLTRSCEPSRFRYTLLTPQPVGGAKSDVAVTDQSSSASVNVNEAFDRSVSE